MLKVTSWRKIVLFLCLIAAATQVSMLVFKQVVLALWAIGFISIAVAILICFQQVRKN